MQNYKDEVQKEKFFKPRLFTFPDFTNSNTVFDYDDLQNEDSMMVLCVRAKPDLDEEDDILYIWKGN